MTKRNHTQNRGIEIRRQGEIGWIISKARKNFFSFYLFVKRDWHLRAQHYLLPYS